jgi:hypothetical protein
MITVTILHFFKTFTPFYQQLPAADFVFANTQVDNFK